MRSILRALLLVVACLACLASEPQAVWASQKLFLKDGTYQLVSSYEVNGDRVRYYSVERSAWEEIPLSLVDLDATKRAQEQEKAVQQKQLEEGREILQERFDKPSETGFEVAPGVHLPLDEGIYAFDGRRVIRLIQSTAEVVTDKRRAAFAMAVPGHLLKGHVILELPGPRAAVRLQQALPTFYVQAPEGLGARVELVTVKVVKESRVVEKLEASRAGLGKPAEAPAAVPLQRTQLAPGLYCLKLLHPLDPGEYALGDLDQQGANLVLWPFGLFEMPGKNPTKKPPPSPSDQE
jgi:hypothetical protein